MIRFELWLICADLALALGCVSAWQWFVIRASRVGEV